MKTTINKDGNEVTLIITADKADMELSVKNTYNKLRSSVTAKGFRPGKAPNDVIDREIGADQVQTEALDAIVEKLYKQSIEEHDLRPISNPHVSVKKFVPYTELEVEIEVGVIPEVTLGDYKKIKEKSEEVKVEDEEVNQVIASLQDRLAKREEVKRAAKEGDEVEVDFTGKKDGKEVPGAKAEGYPLVIGSDRFIPGFEKEIVGLKADDEKKFKIKFPDDYAERPLAGQEVEFEIKVNKVSKLTPPKLDDEFAKNAGPFENLASLKEDVAAHLKSEKEKNIQRELENKVVQKVVDKAKVEIPEAMIEQEVQRLNEDLEQQLQEKDASKEDYLKETKQTAEELDKSIAEQAQNRVKTALVLTEVANQEKLEVTSEELEVRMQVIAGQYQDESIQKQLQEPSVRREIASQMLAEKTVQHLVELATKA
ncbi:MAG: trigger factor [Candidatus Saccharimonadales bacterium]